LPDSPTPDSPTPDSPTPDSPTPDSRSFDSFFFGNRPESGARYVAWIEAITGLLLSSLPEVPYTGCTPDQLKAALECDFESQAGAAEHEWQRRLADVVRRSVAVWHPRTAAHLHTPVLLPALVAEAVISALNQSMDSFDQAPAATIVEQQVTEWLCRIAGMPVAAAGTFTAGGTQSNYMGLLLARDHFLATRWKWDARVGGLPPEASRMRILCSEAAHFSVEKSAIQLGLGLKSVVKVACDSGFRMSMDHLARCLLQLRREGLEPFALVATAGTTDFGSIDPIGPIAAQCAREQLWLHVDAAYGGALLLSPRYRRRLEGLGRADSIAMDFHKAFFQPISCGAFLLADARRFDLIRVNADYLNSESREREGIPDLVTQSVLTSRRFDALKLWLSVQTLGLERFAAMIERLVELGQAAAKAIRANAVFELLHEPEFGCVVFRHAPLNGSMDVNEAISRDLFERGRAVIGHTVVGGRACLKLTMGNPCATEKDIQEILGMITESGARLAAGESATRS
jgi:L-2,4-diaminobutyrate decarboxylase